MFECILSDFHGTKYNVREASNTFFLRNKIDVKECNKKGFRKEIVRNIFEFAYHVQSRGTAGKYCGL